MNHFLTRFTIILFSISSLALYAADIPQDVIGSQKFDAMRCYTENSQTCINSVCLNSDQIDCQDNCRKMAKEKCQQQANE